MQVVHIYAVIIGSEILERRRKDLHFDYLSQALEKVGHSLFATYIIKDDPHLIKQTFSLIKNDSQSILFSFGGIGSTPDDLTRALSAQIFRDGTLHRHPDFKAAIEERLKERAYPLAITMADLPKEAGLLHNPINNMSGYHLDERYFFMPGFPQMAHPMCDEIITTYLPTAPKIYELSYLLHCTEGLINGLLQTLPKEITLSCLPMLHSDGPRCELRLSAQNANAVDAAFRPILTFLHEQDITVERLS